MNARSSHSSYLEKPPPWVEPLEEPRVWLVETGELLPPVAIRMPAVKPSSRSMSKPKRMRKRLRSRFWSAFNCGENTAPVVSKGAPVLMAVKLGKTPVVSLPEGYMMLSCRPRMSPKSLMRWVHSAAAFGAAHCCSRA